MIINGGYSAGAADVQSQRRRLDYEALAHAIAAGDLDAAHVAYANILSQLPSGSRPNPDSILGKIGSALQAGDLVSAKQFLNWGDKRKAPQAPVALSVVKPVPSPVASGDLGADASSAIAMSQAIQTGDRSKAKTALKNIIADLMDVATSSSLSGPAARGVNAYSRMSTTGSPATELLQSPYFHALEDAIDKGDPTGMKTAWALLISGALNQSTPTRRTASLASGNSGFTQSRAVGAI